MTLNDVKPGDQVILRPVAGYTPPRPVGVERVTATQIITTNGQRFRRDDGREVGKRMMDASAISPATPKKLAAIREHERRNTLARNIRQAEYSRLSTDQLERIWAILTEKAADEAESEEGQPES